jgi:DNA-binding MarR family transcriptional regulator/GNAT superfamily N-acetyltransferase
MTTQIASSRKKGLARIRHFNRFYTSMLGILDKHFLNSPFSLSEGRVLYEIHQDPGCMAIAIKHTLNMDEGYLSRILNRFVKQGLLKKVRLKPDGRSFGLSLTAKGEEAFRRLNAASDLEIGRVTDHLSDPELDRLADSMTEIERDLTRQRSPAISPDDIHIRTSLHSGDLGYIAYLHGKLYFEEFGYGLAMEAYIAEGLAEFSRNYDPAKDGVWICEHNGRIVGSLFLMHREKAAQLRYFLIDPAYRGLGLGAKLMEAYMDFFRTHGYDSSYLWTLDHLYSAASIYKRHGFVLTEEKETMTMGRKAKEQRYDYFAPEPKVSLADR